ncbi:hypothetical protein BDF19DRAFT_453603 [Syncephalis fuscata]|nr:hypothetical protein BDF19DRAFT_453603 [Syncephalis fuscata]
MDPLQAPIFHPSRSPQYLSESDNDAQSVYKHRLSRRKTHLSNKSRRKQKKTNRKGRRSQYYRRRSSSTSEIDSVSTLSDTDKEIGASLDSAVESDDEEEEQQLTLATARTPLQKLYVLTRDHILLPFVHGFFWGLAANVYRWTYTRWLRGPDQRILASVERQAEGTGLGIGLGAM